MSIAGPLKPALISFAGELLPPSDGTNQCINGTKTWSFPYGSTSHLGANYLAVCNPASANTSCYAVRKKFGFTIPSDAIIDGIVLEIDKHCVANNRVKDSRIRLSRAGVIETADKADTATFWTNAYVLAVYGGNTDLWSATWTPTDINNALFGCAVEVVSNSGGVCTTTFGCQITVHYNVGGAGGGFSVSRKSRKQFRRVILAPAEEGLNLPAAEPRRVSAALQMHPQMLAGAITHTPARRLPFSESEDYVIFNSRKAGCPTLFDEPTRGRITRTIQSPDEPPADVAGWVPPRVVAKCPEFEPSRGKVKRGIVNDDITDFVVFKSKKARTPEYDPPRGKTKRSIVPHTDEDAQPIMMRRGLTQRITDIAVFMHPGSLSGRRWIGRTTPLSVTVKPPWCVMAGEVFSPGVAAGDVVTPGLVAGQVSCE